MPAGKPRGWVLAGCLGLVGCGGASTERPETAAPVVEQPGAPAAPVVPDAPSVPVVVPPPPLDSTPLPPADPPRPVSCPVTQERRLHWLIPFPGRVSALTTNAREQIAFFTETPEGDAAGLLDLEGQPLWLRPGLSPLVRFGGMSVAPSTGRFYAWGSSTSAWGNLWGAVAYSFDASGQQPTLIGQGCDECSLGPYREDADGNLLQQRMSSRSSGISYTSRAGESWSLWSQHDYDNSPGMFHYAAAAFDPQGQVVILATLQDTTVFQGRTFGQSGQFTFVVLKLSARKELLWARELPVTWGSLTNVGVADSGQVVVRGYFGGRLDWPGAPIPSSRIIGNGFLLALDAGGVPRWFQSTASLSYSLEVAPSGASVIMSRSAEPSQGVLVEEFAPEGCLRWSQTWAAQESEGRVNIAGVAWSGEDLVLGGFFNGTVDFGSGPQQAPLNGYPSKGFLVKLHHP